MAAVHAYITFNGNCEEAFNHYQSTFGGTFGYVGRFKEMPSEDGQPSMSEEDGNKIMHISLAIGNTLLMGSDTGGEWATQLNIGNNISLSYTADSREEADRIFKALSEDGEETMKMSDQFWGDYFGMCTDKFGINWMIGFGGNM